MSVVVLMADSEESVRLTWLVSVRLLDTTGRWCGLASLLGGKLLTWGLATSGLACDGMLARGWRCVWCGVSGLCRGQGASQCCAQSQVA